MRVRLLHDLRTNTSLMTSINSPLYQELRRVFLDSWSDANGWASMLRMIADREEIEPATAWLTLR